MKTNIMLISIMLIIASGIVNAATMLQIYDIDAWVDGKAESGVTSTGGTIDNVKPESTLKINIDLKNNYDTSNGNLDIEDINVNARIIDIEDDGSGDLESDLDISKISPTRKRSTTFEFKIPLEVEDKTYSLEIVAEGRDENGTIQKVEETLDIEIEKNSHELKFYRTDLNPETICEGSALIDAGLVNIGTNDEDVTLQIKNSELSLNDESKFKLDAEPFDDTSKKLQSVYVIVPKNTAAKKYPIGIKAFYSSKILEKSIDLTVSCTSSSSAATQTASQVQSSSTAKAASSNETKQSTVVVSSSSQNTVETTIAQSILTPSQSQFPATQYVRKTSTGTIASSGGSDSSFIMYFVVFEILLAIILIAGILFFKKR